MVAYDAQRKKPLRRLYDQSLYNFPTIYFIYFSNRSRIIWFWRIFLPETFEFKLSLCFLCKTVNYFDNDSELYLSNYIWKVSVQQKWHSLFWTPLNYCKTTTTSTPKTAHLNYKILHASFVIYPIYIYIFIMYIYIEIYMLLSPGSYSVQYL